MTKHVHLVAAAAIAAAVAVAWFRLFAGFTAWAGPVHVAVSGVIAAVSLAAIVASLRRSVRACVAIALGLLAAQVAIIATSLAGVHLVGIELFPSRRVAAVVGALLALSVAGLCGRRLWARWLGLAFGAMGVLSGGLNALGYWRVTAHPAAGDLAWSRTTYETAWAMWVTALGGALVVLSLAAPWVGEAFAARARGTAWASRDRRIALLRATIIAAFLAGPMLLVYAWLQPIAPATRDTALGLAAALAVGGTLAVRGKVLGALVLVGAGAGLLAQTLATWCDAPAAHGVAAYYAAFWLPAGLLAIATGVVLVRPAMRLLRGE